MGYRLGVDLGTTYTAAALTIDGRAEMLSLGNRATQIASVLFVKEDGQVLVGEPAEYRGAADPTRLVREFKRRIGDSVPLIVGGAPYSPQSLLARVLAWVVEAASQQQGAPPEHVCVTYPANWGPFKFEILEQVIKLAGLRGVSTCTEPEAAAIAYAARDRVPEGTKLAVYDLGGGTFDAAVLIRDGAGFRLVGAPDGVEHLGGVDFDTAICQHVLAALGPAAEELDHADPATLLGITRLRRDCVIAKETLSSDTDTVIPVALPGISTSVTFTRAEFEDMVRPAIGETVSAMRRALGSAGVAPADLTAILLVGGSSRIPLVGEELKAAFGRPLALDNHPKHAVALGAAIRATAGAQPFSAQAQPRSGQPRAGQPAAQPSVAAAVDGAGMSGSAAMAPAGARAFAPPHGPEAAPQPVGGPSPRWGAASASPQPPRPGGRPAAGSGGYPPPPGPPPSDRQAPPPLEWDPVPASGWARRWVAIGAIGVVVVVAAVLGIVLLPRAAAPQPTPSAAATATPGTPTPTPEPTVAGPPLPASPQPLATDVIVWPQKVAGNWNITTITAAGVDGPALVASPDEETVPVITADRRTIVYLHRTSAVARELRVMGADGSGDRPLFSTVPSGCTDVTRPAFGSRPVAQLVVPCVNPGTGDTTLKLVKPDGTVVREIDRGWLSDPAMTADGTTAVYWRDNETRAEGGAIWRAPLDGSAPPAPITPGGTVRDNDPAVSPTADLVAITRAGEGIWTVGLDAGNRLTQLTAGPTDQDPSWSPDGSRLVFKRQDEMWVMNADGGGAHRISKPGDIGTAAAWSPR